MCNDDCLLICAVILFPMSGMSELVLTRAFYFYFIILFYWKVYVHETCET